MAGSDTMTGKAAPIVEARPLAPQDDPPRSDPASMRAAMNGRLGIGVPLDEIRAWVESWDTDQERPPPEARKIF